MIRIELTTAVGLYLTLALTSLGSLWAWTLFRQRGHELLPPQQVLRNCEYCSHTYLKRPEFPISRCPQCSSLNKEKIAAARS